MSEEWRGRWAALGVGLLAFVVFGGIPGLYPANTAWLGIGDLTMNQISWMYFRDAPWTLPLGANPSYGLELSSSIAIADGLPLFAIPFKLLAPLLPADFQYFGLWILVCFVLQAFFAYMLAREMNAPIAIAILAAAFVVIAPTFLFRIAKHPAVGGHWTILLALYGYLRHRPVKSWFWPLVVGMTPAIHAYLVAMVAAIWVASIAKRLLLRESPLWRLAVEVAATAIVTGVVAWAVGLLMVGSSSAAWGYGEYKFNLLGFIIPYDWSLLFPQVAHTEFDYEGLSFLGIGILALSVIALIRMTRLHLAPGWAARWLPLIVLLVAFTVFALSNRITAADIDLLTIPVPDWFERLAATFRATGRFVWPVVYIITIGVVVAAGTRFGPRVSIVVICLALGLQVTDTFLRARQFPQRVMADASWPSELRSPFWERAAAADYQRVREVPFQGMFGDWRNLSYYAVTHGMATDAVYLARFGSDQVRQVREGRARELETGEMEQGTIYRLDANFALDLLPRIDGDDLLARIDGRIIYVRDGAALVDGLGIAPQLSVEQLQALAAENPPG